MGEDRVARRLAAILAADVAGYSRLMGADESGTARTLRDHRAAIDPVVANHGGRIVKTTGDGILLEFPSIVAAVECAIAVQKLMARRNTDVPIDSRMLFRIGINLGDVLIVDEDILGDGVNIAARLESISEPGGIYISEAAYVQVRDKLDVKFEDIGEQRLKNIQRPVRVYRFEAHGGEPAVPQPNLRHQEKTLDRRAAIPEPEWRCCSRLLFRWNYRRHHHRVIPLPIFVRYRAQLVLLPSRQDSRCW